MKISFSTKTPAATEALVVVAFEKRRLSRGAVEIDAKTKGALKQAMAADRFTGAENEFLDVLAPAGVKTRRVVVAGLGKADSLDALAAQKLGGNLVAHLNRVGVKRAAVDVDGVTDGADIAATDFAANVAYGMRLRGYRFGKYRTKEKPKDKPTLDKLTVVVRRARTASAAFGELDRIADGVFFTRDLVSEPANVIYPESLARRARTLSKLGVKVEVLDVARMRKLGMGALLGVGQGSARGSRMVVMRWNGAPKGSKAPPVAFVGKGVTFDTGGISIKPAGGMEDMKWDMAGAGVVIGLMKVLAGRGARLDAVGVVGLVENMPSATAQRPGDVVTSMSGQTIEVINTDAEGRLVLADALWYCRSRFKPRVMVNLATLTGAIIVALGSYHAGLFSNDDDVAGKLIAAGEATGEPLWRMPLGERYDKDINSDIADMKNVGKGREAGSITAAQFLQRFVDETPWAHLDIAAVAWSKTAAATVPKGGTGFGVRLLDRFVADNYEAKKP
ncbi:MAG: leucyl aminopeptidase [Proteobacteria bacterium]|nr:leucyl aminopeptidase [Pseudomonadota bacterium]